MPAATVLIVDDDLLLRHSLLERFAQRDYDLLDEVRALRCSQSRDYGFDAIIGNSPAMQKIPGWRAVLSGWRGIFGGYAESFDPPRFAGTLRNEIVRFCGCRRTRAVSRCGVRFAINPTGTIWRGVEEIRRRLSAWHWRTPSRIAGVLLLTEATMTEVPESKTEMASPGAEGL